MTSTERLLSEFIDAWNAGRRPRVVEYLGRVPEGPQRDELAEQIGTWLEVAPTPEYDPGTRAQIRGEPAVRHVFDAVGGDAGLWPTVIPQLRAGTGLSIRQLAARLVERFDLGGGSEDRAAEYLERMERGDLEAARVSRRLLDALGELLGASGRALADAGRLGGAVQATGASGALFRAGEEPAKWVARDIEALSLAAMTPAPPEMDELDRLFTGGPEA